MAAGSQGEKGYNALLVIKAITEINKTVSDGRDQENTNKVSEEKKNNAIATIKRLSPIRFIIRVKTPLVIEDWF